MPTSSRKGCRWPYLRLWLELSREGQLSLCLITTPRVPLYIPKPGEVVLLHDERNLVKIEELLKGSDGQVRDAVVWVPLRSSTTILRRPLSQLYPLEIKCRPTADLDESSSNEVDKEPQQGQDEEPRTRLKRAAAQ